MEPIETIDYKGCKIHIHQDQDPESPREWDNLGVMVCFHKRYTLGDENHGLTSDMFHGWVEVEKYLTREKHATIVLPLYLYDHSGLRIKVGDFRGLLPQGHAEFDSGQVGFIYASKETILKEYKVKRITKAILAKVEKVLDGEVTDYDDYLSGNVYGFIAEDEKGNHCGSCWGFFGDWEKSGLINSAKTDIDTHLANRQKTKEHKLRQLIINKVPLEKRQLILSNL